MSKAKAFWKRTLAFIMLLVIFCGVIPASNCAASGGVQAALDAIRAEFPEGAYFTTDGNPNSSGELTDVLRARGMSTVGYDQSWTCLAFAKYVWARVFGHSTATQKIEFATSRDDAQVAWGNAMPGDLVYFYTNSSLDGAYWKHAAIFLGKSGNTVSFVDCNYYGTNQIKYYSATIGGWGWPYSYFRLYHATNYDAVNGQAASPINNPIQPVASEASQPATVVQYVNCASYIECPKRVVNLFKNITDTTRYDYFSKGQTPYSTMYAVMSDGSKWYKVGVSSKGIDMDLWLKEESDINVKVLHTFTSTKFEDSHPHREYRVCDCGYFEYTGETATVDSCAECHPHIHNLSYRPARSATCMSEGNISYWCCVDCGMLFSDASATLEIDYVHTVTKALGHNYIDGVCTRDGVLDPNYTKIIETQLVSLPRVTVYSQGQFSDIPADQWFTAHVAEAFELGIMKGDSTTTFNPYGDVTIAEAITMAARINSKYYHGDEHFEQADENRWYQGYLDYAYKNGIISLPYYNCDVSQKATRAQFAEIFANALPETGLYAQNSIAEGAIPDVQMSSSYAGYVYKLYRAGVLTGSDATGAFSPQTYITRAEAASIVSRMAYSSNRVRYSL